MHMTPIVLCLENIYVSFSDSTNGMDFEKDILGLVFLFDRLSG